MKNKWIKNIFVKIFKYIFYEKDLIVIAPFLVSYNSFSQKVINRNNLQESNIETQCFSNITTTEIELNEGFKAPKHKHLCTVIGYIISGECLFRF